MFAPSRLNELTEGSDASLADDLDQHPFAPPPVELAVEDPLPRAEVELAARDRHHHPAHVRLPRMRFVSSGRGFAYRFLQTTLHSGSPCDSANGSRHLGP